MTSVTCHSRRSEVQARRWSREYRSLLVREEIGALERVDDLGRLELLMISLPAPVCVFASGRDP